MIFGEYSGIIEFVSTDSFSVITKTTLKDKGTVYNITLSSRQEELILSTSNGLRFGIIDYNPKENAYTLTELEEVYLA